MKKTTFVYTIGIVLFCGVIGLTIRSLRSSFLTLTPFVISVITLLILFLETKENKNLLFPVAITYLITFISEVIGVNTGFIYGNYEYSTRLGPKIISTPPLIGFLWVVLLLGSLNIFKDQKHPIIKSLCVASLMTAIDIIIEPVAIKLDFWSWFGKNPPLYNYISWFLVSFIGALVLNGYKPKDNLSKTVFWLIAIFFFLLNLTYIQ
ncbi:carotenoid biosynthesis protein [Candidatus Dojkabacteria bacterium]|nr:carotenoid biosynthesis protein [Candidatus Dojkabacteria bacterium]